MRGRISFFCESLFYLLVKGRRRTLLMPHLHERHKACSPCTRFFFLSSASFLSCSPIGSVLCVFVTCVVRFMFVRGPSRCWYGREHSRQPNDAMRHDIGRGRQVQACSAAPAGLGEGLLLPGAVRRLPLQVQVRSQPTAAVSLILKNIFCIA